MNRPVNSYKKLTSVNPDVYEEIDSSILLSQYALYLAQRMQAGADLREALTFNDWLEVES